MKTKKAFRRREISSYLMQRFTKPRAKFHLSAYECVITGKIGTILVTIIKTNPSPSNEPE
jgi:hypothetical protein